MGVRYNGFQVHIPQYLYKVYVTTGSRFIYLGTYTRYTLPQVPGSYTLLLYGCTLQWVPGSYTSLLYGYTLQWVPGSYTLVLIRGIRYNWFQVHIPRYYIGIRYNGFQVHIPWYLYEVYVTTGSRFIYLGTI